MPRRPSTIDPSTSLRAGHRPSPQLLELLTCPTCGGTKLALDRGAAKCRACGLTIDWSRGYGAFPCARSAVSRHYDDLAGTDRFEQPRPQAWMARLDALLLAGAAGVAVEVGCGTGRFLVGLAQRPGVTLAIGTDISASALDVAARKGLPHLLLAPAERLPLRDGSVDSLLASYGTLAHVDFDLFLREAARILKPGGFLGFWNFNGWAFLLRGFLRAERHLLDRRFYPSLVWSPAHTVRHLHRRGFEHVQVHASLGPAGLFRRLGLFPPLLPWSLTPLNGTDVIVTAQRSLVPHARGTTPRA